MLNDINSSIKIKPLILFLVIQLVTFVVGLYSGYNFWPKQQEKKLNLQPNYTSNSALAPAINQAPNIQTQVNNTAPQIPQASNGDNCQAIKGNISSSKSKIYHMPGGAFYDRTDAELCFNTEQEAVNAGFTKSSR